MKLYTVYDAPSESFSPPMTNKTKGEAIRAFTDEVNNPGSMLNKHSEDYSLWEIGEFDPSTGVISPLDVPFCIAKAIEFKELDDKGKAA